VCAEAGRHGGQASTQHSTRFSALAVEHRAEGSVLSAQCVTAPPRAPTGHYQCAGISLRADLDGHPHRTCSMHRAVARLIFDGIIDLGSEHG
jgi:hypothetical protein